VSNSALKIFLGFDAREAQAYAVAARSIRARTSHPVDIQSISMGPLVDMGLYKRPTERRDGRLWDCISDAPCSTEHAIARFWVPVLCDFKGWAVFADCDILCRADIAQLFALANPTYAVMVVKHNYQPNESLKMDAQRQQPYPKKLWSSVTLWNNAHPAHRMLTWSDYLNLWPGRDLHAFRWMWEDQIGELPHDWNHLVGIDAPNPNAKLVHHTLGTPDMPGYEDSEFADEWRAYLGAAVVA
jgi:hypothetical protein